MSAVDTSAAGAALPAGEGVALDPFGYFLDQASAIPGMGGQHASPDPRYCFHTPYAERKAGQFRLVVRLGGVNVRFGQLTVRIHAFRPGVDLDISLAAANRIELDEVGDTVELSVNALAIPDVHYAAYGYFSEPSDLSADDLSVVVFEMGDEDAGSFVQPDELRSTFAAAAPPQASHMTIAAEADFADPGSQPCTRAQTGSEAYRSAWPEAFLDLSDEQDRWSRRVALQALAAGGFLRQGARGLVIDGHCAELPAVLAGAGCQVIVAGASQDGPNAGEADLQLEQLAEGARLDFAISMDIIDDLPDHRAVAAHVQAVMKCLLRGGAGLFLFRARVDGRPSDGTFAMTPQDISRLALSVLSHGSEVVQMNYAWNARVALFDPRSNAFILQTRR